MGKIVILEGPDASGKTTFAKYLSDNHGYVYHHEGVPPKNTNLFEYYGCKLNDAKLDRQNHVFDRQFLGQLIYGPIHRNEAAISAIPFMRLVCGWDVKMFIFNTDYDSQHIIWQARWHQEYIQSNFVLKRCWNAWNEIAEKYPLIPEFNYKHDSYDALMDIIGLDFSRLPATIIGSPEAEYLFVGERANSSVLDLPFFTNQGSSGYLQKAIELAGFKEHEIAFTNAFDIYGSHVPWKEATVNLPNLRQVICLGHKAFSAATGTPWRNENASFVAVQNSASIVRAPHPAY